MTAFVRAMALAALLGVVSTAQSTGTLHIKIVIADAGETTPVPGHTLLISDNPPGASPRVIRTAPDGTATITLPPGNYTVESDRPVTFHGKPYQWTQIVDVVSGRDTMLALTAANADSQTATPSVTGGSRPLEADPAFLLPRWEASVVRLWTPTARASAFVIDSRGLVATNQKALGGATSAEIQLTPAVKIAARVLIGDSTKDVAVLWVDPQAISSLKPLPLGCAQRRPALPDNQEVFTIGVPIDQLKDITSGTMSDLQLTEATDGGPVFTADGTLVGITSFTGESDRRGRSKVVRQADVCDVLASAEMKMRNATPPSGAHLPIEPEWPLPEAAFKDAAVHRAGSLSPYQVSTQSFDAAFITPVMIFGSRYEAELLSRRAAARGGTTREPIVVQRLLDFGDWSEYAEMPPPVLFVRVTPKMVQGFWQALARGAAYTQGTALPAFKHVKSGFARLRAYCGDTDVTPIHPFLMEQRVSDKDTIVEGLYVFEPDAFGPQCAGVKLVLFSEKEPDKGETRAVDSDILHRIQEDFALYAVRAK